jgi:hypothetical protein
MKRLINGLETNDKAYGVDWSRSKVFVYDPLTDQSDVFASLEEAAKAKAIEGERITFFIEATAVSFELQLRAAVLSAFEENRVDAYCFQTGLTSNFRIKHNISKDDKNDAKAIYRIATETKFTLHEFKALRDEDPVREEVEDAIIEDRYLTDSETTLAIAKKVLSGQEIPELFVPFIRDSVNKIRPQVGRILLAAQLVKQQGRGYREFRRIVGNYSNGYGSMLRSEFYWWWVRTVLNARLKKAGVVKETKSVGTNKKTGEETFVRAWTPKEQEMKKQAMQDATKAAKFLWHLV